VSESGKAIRANRNHRFLWDNICPNVEEYKKSLLDLITKTMEVDVSGIHLDGIGFPSFEYCTCERCTAGRKETKLEWVTWRAKIVSDFVGEGSKLVKKNGKIFSATLMPDPCFGKERYGQDLLSLSKYVDFFVIPIYDLVYSTTYWLETLAYAFFHQLEKPIYIELYATNPGPKLKNLIAAIIAVSNYTDGIILATHDPDLAKEIQKKLVKNIDYSKYLERNGCEPMIDIINNWKDVIEKETFWFLKVF
jgi:hypothetical protein